MQGLEVRPDHRDGYLRAARRIEQARHGVPGKKRHVAGDDKNPRLVRVKKRRCNTDHGGLDGNDVVDNGCVNTVKGTVYRRDYQYIVENLSHRVINSPDQWPALKIGSCLVAAHTEAPSTGEYRTCRVHAKYLSSFGCNSKKTPAPARRDITENIHIFPEKGLFPDVQHIVHNLGYKYS